MAKSLFFYKKCPRKLEKQQSSRNFRWNWLIVQQNSIYYDFTKKNCLGVSGGFLATNRIIIAYYDPN